ncbi:hypothetical protein M0802_011102 [Mischocyttarus mexicanus]|nr:hypothetical protein M0802_011102 [Mischocyttarus mexicanus]
MTVKTNKTLRRKQASGSDPQADILAAILMVVVMVMVVVVVVVVVVVAIFEWTMTTSTTNDDNDTKILNFPKQKPFRHYTYYCVCVYISSIIEWDTCIGKDKADRRNYPRNRSPRKVAFPLELRVCVVLQIRSSRAPRQPWLLLVRLAGSSPFAITNLASRMVHSH